MNEDIKKALLGKDKYTFADYCDLMRVLRAPDGCPWDREQTHESIRNNFIEETYEAVEAIDTQDPVLLCEELGDVLMQGIFHVQLEEEAGRFTMEDVISGSVRKLIYRHPHVFADVRAETSEKVLENWDALKSKEKHRDTVTDSLRSVPKPLPALMRAEKIGKKAAKVGFDFDTAEDAAKKIPEELSEVLSAEESRRKEEIGDLLFAVVNTARKYGVHAEEALQDATEKFIRRFAEVERGVIADGKRMEELNISELDMYWDAAKARENGENNQ